MTYANGNVLGRRKRPVQQEADKGRVQAVLGRELGEQRIGHALRHNNEANRQAWPSSPSPVSPPAMCGSRSGPAVTYRQ